MSRSRRKSPIWSHTVAGFHGGQKDDKRLAARRLRRVVRQRIGTDADILPDTRELDDRWEWRGDGKFGWDHDPPAKCMRK